MGESRAVKNRTAERVIMDTERMSRPDDAARMINNSSKSATQLQAEILSRFPPLHSNPFKLLPEVLEDA